VSSSNRLRWASSFCLITCSALANCSRRAWAWARCSANANVNFSLLAAMKSSCCLLRMTRRQSGSPGGTIKAMEIKVFLASQSFGFSNVRFQDLRSNFI
jgi:hypothetical protein